MDRLEAFAQDLALRDLAKVSANSTRWHVQRFLAWATQEGIDPEKGQREDLLSYLACLRAKGLKTASMRNNFSALKNWYDFLIESGQLDHNPIPAIQKKYLKEFKDHPGRRQLISVEDAAKMVRATIDTRDRAILLVFLKTGIRRGELISLDVEDVSLEGLSITLKETAKRSNRIVFFDEECKRPLSRWLEVSQARYKKPGERALFVSNKGTRLQTSSVDALVRTAGMRVRLHEEGGELSHRFTPHCCRHYVTTHLLRAGMSREYVKWIRGDVMKEAIDIYNHIDPEDVRESYLMHVPQLGI